MSCVCDTSNVQLNATHALSSFVLRVMRAVAPLCQGSERVFDTPPNIAVTATAATLCCLRRRALPYSAVLSLCFYSIATLVASTDIIAAGMSVHICNRRLWAYLSLLSRTPLRKLRAMQEKGWSWRNVEHSNVSKCSTRQGTKTPKKANSAAQDEGQKHRKRPCAIAHCLSFSVFLSLFLCCASTCCHVLTHPNHYHKFPKECPPEVEISSKKYGMGALPGQVWKTTKQWP